MSCFHRKTYALALVAFMLLSVPFAASICGDDSDAADTNDYTRWYYNQLDEPMKYAYDGLLASDGNSKTVVVEIPDSVTGNLYDDYINEYSAKLDLATTQLINCLNNERPETYAITCDSAHRNSGTLIYDLEIEFTLEDENTSLKNKAVSDVMASLRFTGDTVEKITSIHDYVVETLSYAMDEYEEEESTGVVNYEIRSLYRALAGDHNVVCEGYAKAFKALCEHNGIPCLLVSGEVMGDKKAPHMWNIVYVDGAWYTVDTTWDDRDGTVRDTYLLVGQNTVCEEVAVAESHSVKRMSEDFGLELPAPLATNEYGSDLMTISFETNGGTAIEPITIKAGTVPTIPTTTRSEHTFEGWYLDSELTTKWDGTAISSDRTLYAKWSSDYDYSYSFEISGIYLAVGAIAVILVIAAVVVTMRRHK